MLKERGILYAPDYVINAGGLMNVYEELEGYNRERALQKVSQLFHSVKRVLDTARKQNITTQEAAYEVARQRVTVLKSIKHFQPQRRRFGKASNDSQPVRHRLDESFC
jgi:leucine dehydrogenase